MYDMFILIFKYTYTWMVDFVWFPCVGANPGHPKSKGTSPGDAPGRVPRSAEPTSPWHFAQPVHLSSARGGRTPVKFQSDGVVGTKKTMHLFSAIYDIKANLTISCFFGMHMFFCFFGKHIRFTVFFSLIICVVRCMAEWEKTMVFVLRGTLDGRDQIYCKLNSLSLDAVF